MGEAKLRGRLSVGIITLTSRFQNTVPDLTWEISSLYVKLRTRVAAGARESKRHG